MSVDPRPARVIVEKINMVSRHTKPARAGPAGRLLQKGGPIYAARSSASAPKLQQAHPAAHKLLPRQKGPRLQKCGR